jgi:hypothetical protein
MTTTNTYNPIFRAFRELTTPQAFRWYGTQAKATATFAKAIAYYSFTTARHLLSDRKPVAIAAIAEPEFAQTIAPAVQDDSDAVAGFENAISPQQEHAQTEATEAQGLSVPDGWEAIEANDTAVDELEQAEVGWEAIALATAPEPELDDSESDRIAIDEPEQAMLTLQESASTEPPQAITLSDAEAIAPEPNFGEADAELSGADEALLDDEDPTERRYWAGDGAEGVESPVMSHQWEEDAEALAGDEA